jgi:hypothetical protein
VRLPGTLYRTTYSGVYRSDSLQCTHQAIKLRDTITHKSSRAGRQLLCILAAQKLQSLVHEFNDTLRTTYIPVTVGVNIIHCMILPLEVTGFFSAFLSWPLTDVARDFESSPGRAISGGIKDTGATATVIQVSDMVKLVRFQLGCMGLDAFYHGECAMFF